MRATTGFEFDSLLQLSLCVVACVWFDSLKAPAQPHDFAGRRAVRSGSAMFPPELVFVKSDAFTNVQTWFVFVAPVAHSG
jgi:hypothetical protein